jgi:hypothetical protein
VYYAAAALETIKYRRHELRSLKQHKDAARRGCEQDADWYWEQAAEDHDLRYYVRYLLTEVPWRA